MTRPPRRRPPTVGRRLRVAFAVLIAMLVVNASAGIVALWEATRHGNRFVRHAQPLHEHNAGARQALTDAQSAIPAFRLTGSEEFLEPYARARDALRVEVA